MPDRPSEFIADMNLESLQKKLLAAARGNPPSSDVPYAFEKRVRARLQNQPALDLIGLWAHALWRAVVPCVAVAVVIGVWSSTSTNTTPSNSLAENEDFSQHFERVMLAGVGEPNEEIW
jgi:hypothetical protein